ncbi:MAG: tRNA (adenosine(37)-N6)-threonylcarbamoyltransferase complex dimerization subunit type 1 TsaB [Candidatus Aminicenantes bacterium]
MLLLSVDTCDSAGSAAVMENTRLLGEINIESPLTHSERLMAAVDFLLRELDLDLSRIDGYALASGPGSFTGIRIGMSTVKALSYSFSKPIAPVSRLHALAFKLNGSGARLICPFLDAKKKEVYAALYEKKENGLQLVVPECAYSPDDFLARLPGRRVIHFIGSGTHGYRDKIRRYCHDKARISRRSFFVAGEVGRLGYEMIKKNQGVDNREVVPLYLRKPQAEEKH